MGDGRRRAEHAPACGDPALSVAVVFETHSTSVDNERGIATGWLPGELSATGREQAHALGARRRDDGLAAVFTSDLRRAVETAEIAFAGSRLPVIPDARLRECNYGSMNGMPRVELDALRSSKIDEPWPGGESWREAVERVEGFLRELRAARDAERVLVIGHVATRWALDRFVHGVQLEQLVDEPFAWQEGWEYVLS